MSIDSYRDPGSSQAINYTTDSDPTIGLGIPAEPFALCVRTDIPGLYCHTGPLDTDWTIIGTPGGGGTTVDFVGSVELNTDESSVSLIPVDINGMSIPIVTTKANQVIEIRGTASGVNNAGGTNGFAISFAVDGVDIPRAGSTGPVGGTAGTAALIATVIVPIIGAHTVTMRWATFGAGTMLIHALAAPAFEGASMVVWGYTN